MANPEDKNSDIYEIEIEEFLEDGIPWLIENNIGIAVFPIPDNPETIDMKAIQFAASVNKILDESYDEALDLPLSVNVMVSSRNQTVRSSEKQIATTGSRSLHKTFNSDVEYERNVRTRFLFFRRPQYFL